MMPGWISIPESNQWSVFSTEWCLVSAEGGRLALSFSSAGVTEVILFKMNHHDLHLSMTCTFFQYAHRVGKQFGSCSLDLAESSCVAALEHTIRHLQTHTGRWTEETQEDSWQDEFSLSHSLFSHPETVTRLTYYF